MELTWNADSLKQLRSALGPDVLEYIEDKESDVTDVFLRPRWCAVERLKIGFERTKQLLPPPQIAKVLALLAPALSKELSLADPEIQVTLRLSEDGPRVRFTGNYAGAAGLESILTIRIPRVMDLPWEEAVHTSVIPLKVSVPLAAHLSSPNPEGILIVGPVGSGKTTTLRTLIRFQVDRGMNHHYVLVEDEIELDFGDEPLFTNIETTQFFTFDRAIRSSKRHRPTRLVVGEALGAEALPAVKAGANGAGLMMTIHGKTIQAGVRTLQGYMAEGANGITPNPRLITDAVKIVLCMARTREGFTVREAGILKDVTDRDVIVEPFT